MLKRPRLPKALRRSAPAPAAPAVADFEVELARSGRVVPVPVDASILDTAAALGGATAALAAVEAGRLPGR